MILPAVSRLLWPAACSPRSATGSAAKTWWIYEKQSYLTAPHFHISFHPHCLCNSLLIFLTVRMMLTAASTEALLTSPPSRPDASSGSRWSSARAERISGLRLMLRDRSGKSSWKSCTNWRRLLRQSPIFHDLSRPPMNASIYVILYYRPIRPIIQSFDVRSQSHSFAFCCSAKRRALDSTGEKERERELERRNKMAKYLRMSLGTVSPH